MPIHFLDVEIFYLESENFGLHDTIGKVTESPKSLGIVLWISGVDSIYPVHCQIFLTNLKFQFAGDA